MQKSMPEFRRKHEIAKRVAERIGSGGEASAFSVFSRQTGIKLAGFNIWWVPESGLGDFLTKDEIPTFEITLINSLPGISDMHVHEVGSSLFYSLGPSHGFAIPATELLIGPWFPHLKVQEVKRVPLKEKGVTIVYPYAIHGFETKPDGTAWAIAVTSPRISKGPNEFDLCDIRRFRIIE
ncbi:MAG: hypothetical protein JWO73_689 [Candidatus Taylorbacteria bacterium]|nr:hypothetical protein [Candidatus Taylorbacteria bacterium]